MKQLTLMMRNINLALSLLLLAGCADFNAGWNGAPSTYTNNDPYARSDFDELLTFGANMANISSSSRTEVCGLLLNRREPPDAGIWLHLMVGRLLSDNCGDIPKILDGLQTIPPGSLPDQRLQKLVDIDTEALKRMNSAPTSRKSGYSSRRQKTARSVQEAKETTAPKEPAEAKSDETRMLREKLDAIRSMEKQLDASGGE